jgi:hypothetical protein
MPTADGRPVTRDVHVAFAARSRIEVDRPICRRPASLAGGRVLAVRGDEVPYGGPFAAILGYAV